MGYVPLLVLSHDKVRVRVVLVPVAQAATLLAACPLNSGASLGLDAGRDELFINVHSGHSWLL